MDMSDPIDERIYNVQRELENCVYDAKRLASHGVERRCKDAIVELGQIREWLRTRPDRKGIK
jgi:hypothetical protein